VSLQDTIQALQQLIPVLATLTGHPQVGVLAQQLISIANGQLQSQADASGKTTAQLLEEAAATWDAALQNAESLRSMEDRGGGLAPGEPMRGAHGPGDEP
jgi:hypothetical protein